MIVNLIIFVLVAVGFLLYMYVFLPRSEQKRVDRRNARFECLRQFGPPTVDRVTIIHTKDGFRRADNVRYIPNKKNVEN